MAARPHSGVAVVTVDDQPFFRRAVRDIVAATGGFVVVGEAESADQAVAVVGEVEPDLVLVDVRMPAADGFETTRRIKALCPRAVVVLVSIGDVSAMEGDVARCGAAALFQKQGFGPDLLRGIWATHGTDGRRPVYRPGKWL